MESSPSAGRLHLAVGALIVFATPVIIIFGLRKLWSAFVVRSETEVVTPMPRPTSP
jgi:hypothetical protein